MEKVSLKQVIHTCIARIIEREQKEYAKLNEIYEEVAAYLEVENDEILQSQIRGRLQECCEQYKSFLGEPLFLTEKIRSGNWTIKTGKKFSKKKYLRFTHNTYLVTDNNWNDLRLVKEITEQYVLEENSDSAYKARLIHLIGKDKALIIIDELNLIRKLLRDLKNIDKVNDGYGTAFEVFVCSVLHNIAYEEAINKYVVHGDSDGKIDVIYYGDLENIYIYQVKVNDINDEAYNAMEKNYISCMRGITPNDGKDLFEFIKTNEHSLSGKAQNYRSVSNNSKKQSNYKPIQIYEMFFKNKVLPLSHNDLTLEILKPTLSGNDRNSTNLQYNVSTDGYGNYNFYIKAGELVKYLLRALGVNRDNYDKDNIDISKYFFDNVRGVLSVNKKMVYTIENEPVNFVKYNNGISITGSVRDTGSSIIVKNPIINNGQQTITTLIRIGKNLDKITVPVKITNEDDMVIKSKISQFSNEQVKVKAIDMLSLNTNVRNIQEIIFSNDFNGENYFLEIYSSGRKSYYDIVTKLYKKNNIIGLLDFMKLYFSIENSKDLGAWKNSPNMQVEKTKITDPFNEQKSFRVCEAIAKFDNYIETVKNKKDKDDLKSADLAFKYLLCKERLSVEEALSIITSINKKYFYDLDDKKSKLIDIYKSPTIIVKLEEELELRNNKNDKVHN